MASKDRTGFFLETFGRSDIGALGLRPVGLKSQPPMDVADARSGAAGGKYHPAVALDLDCTDAMPRRLDGT